MRTDRELVDAVLRGETEAEEELVERLRPWVVGLAVRRFSLSGDEAEEVLQSAVLRLFESDRRALRTWRGEARLTTWVSVVVTRICLARRTPKREAPVAVEAPESLPAPPMADPVVAAERRDAVRTAAARLGERDRLLLALRYGDGRSPQEIATALGLRPGTARKALHDARRRLRERLLEDAPELFADPEETTS